ncbi:hypothetical protein METBIDRAFT_45047 [Metschnikowia bicuspidata var. bicuspidata NRRL YB-4993]|uniref:RNase III domain-containing protein n=1 Tax=Metschnikowia bicuspidata var. bicuspidata NRRL YB-4993 TaxID=869754 RepID=A0A1A0H7G7_9ASCO|nr:hypothetical protein METBIDRAFT_45047 [Metschnikowia bicuspidata var. bicuspidata NRRL YB-4993]OBA19837.1 hypothetical protein METBIDRAFT_45047 [Metschnikowia bicuspidata var. bicuspidata NRRL YB-4993]
MSDPVLAWCDDIHLVRGNVSQLQATLNQIITKTPTVTQYKNMISTYDSPDADKTTDAPSILEKLRSIMHSPQVKVAVRLKSLYDRGYLPFLLGLSRINFRSQKSDRFVGYLLDYNPPKVDSSEMFPEEGDFIRNTHNDPENVSYPPSLPPIENQLLLRLVFTDKSLRQPSDFLELEFSDGFHDYNNNHNRKLMLRGKDILNLALNDILDQEFPAAHEDDLVYLKHRLTSTSILAKLAFCYNFSDTVMHQIDQNTPTAEKLIIFKNVFLAYIGGMSKLEYTFQAIRLWIGRLYNPLICKLQADKGKSQLKNVSSLAYVELNFMFRRVNNLTEEPTKRIRYEFKTLNTEVPVACQLVVSNVKLGIGLGSTLEEAKHKAAHTTFETPELRSQLMDILVSQIRIPLKEKDLASMKEASSTGKESVAEDDAYSPEISADEYEPEVPQSSNGRDTTKITHASLPKLNYNDWPPQTSQRIHLSETESVARTTEPPRAPKMQYVAPKHIPHHHNKQQAANGPSAAQTPARKPLPYGMLPPIPNMKKKGGTS